MDEKLERSLREEAIRRRLAGESVSAVARSLNRSREWVHLWLRRYDPDDPDWSVSRSRAAKRVVRQLPPEVTELVVAARKRLAAHAWEHVGAEAILWELKRQGLVELPSPASVKRILAREGLAKPRVRERRGKSGIVYPEPEARAPGDVHEADFLGPRHLEGGPRFFLLVSQDRASRHLGLELLGNRSQSQSWPALQRIWSRLGKPERLKLDNHAAFSGRLDHPGGLMRACLWQGVTPVFIPYREPWRNGMVEKSNDLIQRQLLRRERFDSLETLERRLGEFEGFRNERRGAAEQGRRALSDAFGPVPKGWPQEGRAEFVRFIRSDLRLYLYGRSWPLPEALAYSYVTAVLDVAKPPSQGNLLVVDASGELQDELGLPVSWHKESAMR